MQLVKDATAAVYNKGKIDKGLAFPTCISVNNCVGHFSPVCRHKNNFTFSDLRSCLLLQLGSECTDTLKDGDIVKIDLGCHIDGFIAVVATTVAVGQSVVEGKAADVIMAARTAAEAAVKMLKPVS